jgi:hypothetical protein
LWWCEAWLLPPLRGSRRSLLQPTAYAVGYILLPVRGFQPWTTFWLRLQIDCILCAASPSLQPSWRSAFTGGTPVPPFFKLYAQNVRSNVRYWIASAMCLGFNRGSACQIGHRACNLQDAVVSACGHTVLGHRALREALAIGREFAGSADVTWCHLGIARQIVWSTLVFSVPLPSPLRSRRPNRAQRCLDERCAGPFRR